MAAVRCLSEAGAVVVGAGDTHGAIYNASGLDIPKLIRHKERNGSVVGFAGTEPITDDELLAVNCEILVAATVKYAIHGQNASAIRARIVAEATDGSITPNGDHALDGKGVFVIPDCLCNAGADIVAYCEWAQEPNAYGQLERTVQRSFQDVLGMSLDCKVDMRRAAYMLGIGRVAESIGGQAQRAAAAHQN
jgi:glutamate dehydrogenase/leucine dehydrogenase